MLNTEIPYSVVKGILSRKKTYGGPSFVEISPVGYCNFNCVECHQLHHKEMDKSKTGNRQPKTIPIERLRAFVSEVAAMGAKEVEICGRGEPTLYPDLLELIKTIKKHNIYCNLVTNGTRLGPGLADELIAAGLNTITISMYAGTEKGFKKIARAAENISLSNIIANITYFKQTCKDRMDLRVLWLLQEDNICELKDIILLAHRFGIEKQFFSATVPYRDRKILFYGSDAKKKETLTNRFNKQLGELIEKNPGMDIPKNLLLFADTVKTYKNTSGNFYHKVPCYVGWWSMFLADDGTVRPCSNSNLILGQVYSNTAQEIWHSAAYNKFRTTALSYMLRNKKPLPESYCTHCGWVYVNKCIHKLVKNRQRHFFSKKNLKAALGKLLRF